jgi:hypothetical protein
MHKQLQTMTRASGDVSVGECQVGVNLTPVTSLRYALATTRFGYSDVRAGYMGKNTLSRQHRYDIENT